MASLTTGSIPRHLWQQTAPMVLGVASLMSVGIIDAYFVGRVGADALAAISFIFPITVALGSVGVGVMVGINSVLSRALGAGDEERAAQRASIGVALSVGVGTVIAVSLRAGMTPLFRAMNAGEELLPLIESYVEPFALGFPVLLIGQALNGCLRAQGAALRSSSVLWTIAIANWILDPLLIAGWGPFPSYGVAGAAYASVGAYVLATGLAMVWVQRSELPIRRHRLPWAQWRSGGKDLVRVGGPAAVSNSINPIGLSVLTAFLATIGPDAVAGYGAAGRLQSFAVVPLLALSGSIGAIVGQNWGAGSVERAARAVRYAGGFSVAYGLVVAALFTVFAEALGRVFTDDAAVVASVSDYLSLASWGYAGYGVLIVGVGVFNAVGRASVALLISLARVVLVMIPVAFVGGLVARGTSAHAQWIYASELAANLVGGGAAALVAFVFLRRAARETKRGADSDVVQPS